MSAVISRRDFLRTSGALVVGFTLDGAALAQRQPAAEKALGKTLDPSEVDAFLAINAEGTVTIYCGKVDLGQGLRIAIRQMVAEELGCGVERIAMVEGDTALTPDQGATAGSAGVMRGGVQIRQAAATAREALLGLAAERLSKPRGELEVTGNAVRPKSGGAGVGFAELVGNRRFGLKVDPKAPLRDPASYTVVGKPLQRPDVPAKVTGRHQFVHDLVVDGMLHGSVVRPPAVGAKLLDVDEAPIKSIPGARVVRVKDFLGVVAGSEWDAMSAARALKARWSEASALIGDVAVRAWMKAGPLEGDEALVKKGDAKTALAAASKRLSGEYYWPMQSHASMGPSCAIADVRDGKATIWSASQATHRFRETIAGLLGLSRDAVRVIYVDGSGCYGMNGHDDAAADAALLSRAVGKPVRVQWTREDELGWDPKGPPQLLALEGALDEQGRIAAWRTEMWLPKATASLPNMPLLGPEAAGMTQAPGIVTGLISQNGNPPYAVANQEVVVHWLKDAPLRPSNLRAPGKVANGFAVESFTDELAAAARRDALEFRLAGLSDPRGIEVVKRAAALIGWQPRPSPGPGGVGRGMAYLHYKNNETYIAMAMEVEVSKVSGAIRVRRVGCAHDCGLVINPDALKAQIEGAILQTLSRALHEEVKFDRTRVTSVDFASYPILRFPEVPEIAVDLVVRPTEPPLSGGEPASTPVAAALANAVFDAAGVRLRTVPFTTERVRAAIG
ncbi:MAG TPA: molybdopterin cofactor-binding domain-containing protein [Casimicrobiaceae bacterium]|nr:molybdopterin cofactor-binding domain-containing protein [Casimicrobiaceae bacterium]